MVGAITNIAKKILTLPVTVAAGIILLYQWTISPDHGFIKSLYPYGYCRHYPSCSEYARQSLIKYGFLKGIWRSFGRLLRCNPWAEPSVDLA